MSKTLPISEVKTRLPELVSGVEERERNRGHAAKGSAKGAKGSSPLLALNR